MSPEKEKQIGTFQGKTEEELISHIESLSENKKFSEILTNWYIGNNLREFYKKKYKNAKFEIIAKKTGITEDTLKKCWKFAKKCSKRNSIDTFLNRENFRISWWLISQNLDNLSKLYKLNDTFFNLKKNVFNKYHALLSKSQETELSKLKEKLANEEEIITILKAKLARLKNMIRLSVEPPRPRLSLPKMLALCNDNYSKIKISDHFLNRTTRPKYVRWNQKILLEITKAEKVVEKSLDLAKKEGDL
jgi:hypothetical protein